jgi:spermidine/putrescine-binding protein
MSDDSIFDDINLTKKKTITNGKKYDFYVFKTLKLEKEISKGTFGKGDTSISQIKNYKLLDDEGDDLLDVKLQCSKKLDDAMTGFTPKEAKKVMDEVLKRLMKIGLVKV